LKEILNIPDENGLTALHYAANLGHEDCIKYLLDRGAEVNVVDNYHSSPLHHAAARGQTNAISLLLQSGAALDTLDCYAQSPIHYGTGSPPPNFFFPTRVLIFCPFFKLGYLAASLNQPNCLSLLLSLHKSDDEGIINAPDSFGWTPLICASFYGATECTEMLLASPVMDIHLRDTEGRTALHWAAISASTGCVSLLSRRLHQLATVSSEGTDHHHQALFSSPKFFFDIYDQTPLHYLSAANRPDCLEAFLSGPTTATLPETEKEKGEEKVGTSMEPTTFIHQLLSSPSEPEVHLPLPLTFFIVITFFACF